jgi:hypothetical protein
MDKLSRKERLGQTDIFSFRVRATILKMHVELLTKYFTPYPYNVNNFITTDEARDVMEEINRICDVNYMLTDL